MVADELTHSIDANARHSAVKHFDGVVVREHEVLSVPPDPGFKRSPFLDGAIVRYVPPQAPAAKPARVLIAPAVQRPVERGMADASLIAHILVRKWEQHTPLYRQEPGFERFGTPISRANMCRWQWVLGEWAEALVGAMWREALTRSWIATDATGTAVRASPQYRRGHVFVLVAEGDYVLFRYTEKYDSATVEKLFGGYKGAIVADASSCHNVLFGPGKATEYGCWAHAQRRLVAAFRAGDNPLAAQGLQFTKKLFRIEARIKDSSAEQRLAVRQAESAPIVDELFRWVQLSKRGVSNASLISKAFTYFANQSEPLRRFLSNGQVPIHNNSSESALRAMVKGRMNWLFHGSAEHAGRACAVGSLIGSSKVHDLDPEFYLQEVSTVAPCYPIQRMLDLSPKNWVATRRRLIEQGSLKYIDLARVLGSRLVPP
ncbi:MAG: IS66 family transposase [Polyangiaceae bacterium]|nr:IS66 family transposase [Polyangiaceae bacterium]